MVKKEKETIESCQGCLCCCLFFFVCLFFKIFINIDGREEEGVGLRDLGLKRGWL